MVRQTAPADGQEAAKRRLARSLGESELQVREVEDGEGGEGDADQDVADQGRDQAQGRVGRDQWHQGRRPGSFWCQGGDSVLIIEGSWAVGFVVESCCVSFF